MADKANMFDWKSEYSVGVSSIDAQHQRLFAIGRELYNAMSAGHGKSAVSLVLDRLIEYTTVHFAHEERLMRLHQYPKFKEHKAQHEALTQQVLAFQADYRAGRVAMTVQLLNFLKEWLEKHIKGADAAFAPCLKEKSGLTLV